MLTLKFRLDGNGAYKFSSGSGWSLADIKGFTYIGEYGTSSTLKLSPVIGEYYVASEDVPLLVALQR